MSVHGQTNHVNDFRIDFDRMVKLDRLYNQS
jgi:hypothetical protein